jgi:uncharacterized membrane protein YsdA (DUF1294 family)
VHLAGATTIAAVETVLLALVVLNVVSFALFGIDKRRAVRGSRRISENALLLSALVSGTIGAWAGVFVFRHKTRKLSFLIPLVCASLIDLAIAVLLVGR